MSAMTLTEADNGKSIAVALGEELVLRLNENPTTGFRWAVETVDNEIIELHGTNYIPAPTSAVGGVGQRVFVFKAKKSGSVRLLLTLRREWEGDKSIAARFEVNIHVPN